MDITAAPLGHLEKPMKFRWCAVFTAAVLFLECYFDIRFQISLRMLSWGWITSNLDLAESLLIGFAYTFTFGALIPGCGFAGRLVFGGLISRFKYWFETKILKVNDEDFFREYRKRSRLCTTYRLKIRALKENNYSMYQEADKRDSDVEERMFLRFICQSILALTTVDWLISSKTNPTVVGNFGDWIRNLPLYQGLFVALVVSSFWLVIFGLAFEKNTFDRYMLIDEDELKNEDGKVSKAAARLTSGPNPRIANSGCLKM